MQNLTIILNDPVLLTALTGVVGLMVGSFLNVVIYRLPLMMQQTWRRECQSFLELESTEDEEEKTFNLVLPLSHCPHCNAKIKPYQNIPVLSYLFLKGRCAYCKAPISIRYPLIELLTGICSATVAWHFGCSLETVYALLLTWSLIVLSGIDLDQQLLPDSISLPMLWLGLFLSLFTVFTNSHDAIIGAMAGYLTLWSVYHTFKLITGKEGMGYGDFKLLALFGAWVGWQYLPLIILLSSLVGAVIGIGLVIFRKHDHRAPIPFGPYLATAGWIVLIWGDRINQLYLSYTSW